MSDILVGTASWTDKTLLESGRFNYLYSAAEVNALAESMRDLASRARRVHVLFNNCQEDKAQRNAAQFRQLLAGRVVA